MGDLAHLTAKLLSDGPTTLPRFCAADLSAFMAYRSDANVGRFQSWDSMSEVEARSFLVFMSQVDPLLRRGAWAQIAVSTDGQLIGDMGWSLSPAGDELEIGLTLAQAAQGKAHVSFGQCASFFKHCRKQNQYLDRQTQHARANIGRTVGVYAGRI